MRYCPTCLTITAVETCPTDGTPTKDDPWVGETLDGRFKVAQPIGRGGMGTVYRALDVPLSRHVAIKVLRAARASHPDAVGRFMREVKVLAALRHPNTVVLHGFGALPNGSAYMVTELLDGETLNARLKRRGGALALPEALKLGAAVSRSLAQAHRKGIVHRDLKPDNVFHDQVDEDLEVVKVLDFGIAKFFEKPRGEESRETSYKTAQHDLVGTPAFLSPEQIQEHDVDGRADLYALGIILYQCLAGRLPFNHADPFALLTAHVEEAPPPLPTGLPEEVCALVMQLLAKDPAARPATADEVTRRLDTLALNHQHAVETTMVVHAAPPAASVPTGNVLPVMDGPTISETLEERPARRAMRPYVVGAGLGTAVGLVCAGLAFFVLAPGSAPVTNAPPEAAPAALVVPAPPPPAVDPVLVAQQPAALPQPEEPAEPTAPMIVEPARNDPTPRRRPARVAAGAPGGAETPATETRGQAAARLLREASQAFAEGRFKAAETTALEVLQVTPNSVDTHKLMGVILMRQARQCDAAIHYRRAVQLQPNGVSADRIREILKGVAFEKCH